ncbi:MAG: hypothetical protein M0Z85_09410 [Gammaproteobacteria bacterium]|nr:hypothetical protein [Gammaproteobacteria bacterium]
MRVYSIHQPRAAHLAAVTRLMRGMGAPLIRVVDCIDFWAAIEGTHRLRAACDLGVAPQFLVHEPNELITVANMDIADMFPDGTVRLPAREVAQYCVCAGGSAYEIAANGVLICVEVFTLFNWEDPDDIATRRPV